MLNAVDREVSPEGVALACSKLEFARAVSETAATLGFRWCSYMARARQRLAGVSTYPSAWQRHYRAHSYIDVDPIVARAVEEKVPFAWLDTAPFAWDGVAAAQCLTAKQRQLLDDAYCLGIRSGMAFSIDGTANELVLFTFATDERSPALLQRAKSRTSEIRAFCHTFHERFRLHEAVQCWDEPVPHLTPRQRICLSATADGHSAKQIARMLGLAPRTVEHHFQEAKTRLGAATLTQAVAAAVRKRLI